MLPRADGINVGPAVPIEAPTPATTIGDARQEIFQRSLQSIVGHQVQGEILSRFNDGSFLVKVAGTAARMMLPAGSQVGDSLPMKLVSLQPRPTFLLGNDAIISHGKGAQGRLNLDPNAPAPSGVEGELGALVYAEPHTPSSPSQAELLRGKPGAAQTSPHAAGLQNRSGAQTKTQGPATPAEQQAETAGEPAADTRESTASTAALAARVADNLAPKTEPGRLSPLVRQPDAKTADELDAEPHADIGEAEALEDPDTEAASGAARRPLADAGESAPPTSRQASSAPGFGEQNALVYSRPQNTGQRAATAAAANAELGEGALLYTKQQAPPQATIANGNSGLALDRTALVYVAPPGLASNLAASRALLGAAAGATNKTAPSGAATLAMAQPDMIDQLDQLGQTDGINRNAPTNPAATQLSKTITSLAAAYPSQPLMQNATQNTGSRDAPASFSSAGRLISNILAVAQQEGSPNAILGKTAMLPSPATGPEHVATALHDTLAYSGLFYESHVVEWSDGKRPLLELLREPQMQSTSLPTQESHAGPGDTSTAIAHNQNNIEFAQIVNLQLNTLEQHSAQWRGEIWPGQQMDWKVSKDPEHQGKANTQKEQESWQSAVRFNFPELGSVSATIHLIGDHVHIQVRTDTEASASTLRMHADALTEAMGAAGSPLDSLIVRQDDQA